MNMSLTTDKETKKENRLSLNVTYSPFLDGEQLNQLGQRVMQARAYEKRDAQFLLLKAPPASGKSRALMFIALDKMRHQNRTKTIVAVPETAIGASFRTTYLSHYGFEADWIVEDKWNLCLSEETGRKDDGKIQIFQDFLEDPEAKILICTHATFRFGFEAVQKNLEAQAVTDNEALLAPFADIFLAIDEFHHVSAANDNRLGEILRRLLFDARIHVLAMTGSYFRGDAVPILEQTDEGMFQTVTYTYYEQLKSYRYLKSLGVNYSFYRGNFLNGLPDIFDPSLKTILHIPHVNASETYDEKNKQVFDIYDYLGDFLGSDEKTGFDLIKLKHHDNFPGHEGKIIKIANLVDDRNLAKRELVKSSLSQEIKKEDGTRDDEADRAKVDIIIALGMAKEGFDWIWCEHALTIGARASLTEIVQIIGRATRDAPHKKRALFTNLVAEPGVETGEVNHVVNEMLKAISGSLLMEQVLAPVMRFYRYEDQDIREKSFEDKEGIIHIGIKNFKEPPTKRVKDLCENDMLEMIATSIQNAPPSILNETISPEVHNELLAQEIIARICPDWSKEEQEAVKDHALAQMNLIAAAKKDMRDNPQNYQNLGEEGQIEKKDFAQIIEGKRQEAEAKITYIESEKFKREKEEAKHTLFLSRPDEGEEELSLERGNNLLYIIKRFVKTCDISIDLIRQTNIFQETYHIASKEFNEKLLEVMQGAILDQKLPINDEELLASFPLIQKFKEKHGRLPELHAVDPQEQRLAENFYKLRERRRQLKQEG